MKHEINMKRIMQARRVEEKTESSLIKDNTTGESKWMKKNNGNNGTVPEVEPETEKEALKKIYNIYATYMQRICNIYIQ